MSETKRCEVCDWPLAKTMEDGCIEGNCSYRPHEGTAEYFKIQRRRKELAARKAEPVIEVALNHCPGCDEYGASHTTPSIEHPARVAPACPTCGGKGLIALNIGLCPACHPAVPAQEAPREQKVPKCSLCNDVFRPCICVPYEVNEHPAESQAGAQQEATKMKIPLAERIFSHAFHHPDATLHRELNLPYNPDACLTCGETEDRHHWTTTFNKPEEPEGTFACQICGLDSPHEHTGAEIAAFRAQPRAGAQPEIVWGLLPAAREIGMKAGAQVPSTMNLDRLRRTLLRDYGATEAGMYISLIENLQTHLATIKSYVTEAAKTPITREDMHNPLLAQTFYDEAKGFERLVLSEIGGGK